MKGIWLGAKVLGFEVRLHRNSRGVRIWSWNNDSRLAFGKKAKPRTEKYFLLIPGLKRPS
jgi:hypothetical protein